MNKIYAGVGSRETPIEMCVTLRDIAFRLACNNYTLRSGGAFGADTAFEDGCDVVGHRQKEIYVVPERPGAFIRPDHIRATGCEKFIEALKMARDIHPAWHAMGSRGRALHARNCFQVLGQDLQTPVDFLVCWAPVADGSIKGGTRTAWELAKRHNIPCFNLAVMDITLVNESIQRIVQSE